MSLHIDTKLPEVPAWAPLERKLLADVSAACVEFFEHYFDQKTGYLKAIARWGGNDGPGESARTPLPWDT